MKMKTIQLLLICTGACYPIAFFAQQNMYNKVSVASPNAAALGKYADVPVNYHTGIPQISVPVYTIQDGPLELAVGLSYHAAGLKVGEPASWVGAGWSLNAAGVITRTVQGAPDERYTSSANSEQSKGYLSDGGYPNYLWHRDNPSNTNVYTNMLKDFHQGAADGEPDLFFFNFGGYSGKFYFGDDKVPVVLPQQDIKIDYNYTPGLRKSIESFVLTTPDGTRWYFGNTPATTDVDPVERTLGYSSDNGYGNDGKSVSAWYLNKMVSSNGNHQVTLSYEAEKYSYYNVSSSPVAYDLASPNMNSINASVLGVDVSGNGSHLNKVIVEGVRLKQINFTDGMVELVPGALRTDLSGPLITLLDYPNEQAKALAEIKITGNGGSCKKFILTYDYFTDATSKGAVAGAADINTDKKKLKLLQVQEASCDGAITLPPYTFDYHTETVPRSLSFSQDHWGFSNGADNNTLIPTITENQFEEVSGANRDSKWPDMRGGTLRKITYPTGGTADFEYEPNKAWVSYNRHNRVYRFSTAVGYDNNNSSTTYQPFSGNPYQVKLSNPNCAYPATSCLASIQISDANNVLVFSLSAQVGETKIAYPVLPAGTYKIVMYKDGGGQGATASGEYTELIPVLYENSETVGGLRVKSITQSEQARPGTVVKTNYNYEANNRTSGILYSKPVYVQVLKNSGPRYVFTQLLVNGATWRFDSEEPMTSEEPYFSFPARKALKSAAPILAMSTTQGNHIGYNEVKVSKTGNGYSIYRYYGSNIWDTDNSDVAVRKIDRTSSNPAAPEFPAAPLPFDYKRGDLKYEGHFTEAGKLLNEATYIPAYQVQPVTTPGFRVYTESRGSSPVTWITAKTDFELQSQKKISMQVIENNYDALTNNYVQSTKTTLYESPNHSQPTTMSSVNSKAQPIVDKIKYTPDFTIPACVGIDNCWNDYQAALTVALNNYTTASNACTTDECRKAARASYNWAKMDARRNYSQCRMDRLALKSTCLQNAKAAAGSELKPILELQDAFRILPVEQTSWKNNLLMGASFNRFDYDIGSSTSVNINKVQRILLASPSASFAPVSNTGTTITKDSRYTDEDAYRFKNGVLYDMEKIGKVFTAYLWDYGNTKPVAVAVNAKADDIAFTSFETANTGGFIYNEAATTANTTAPAGKKVFALGAGNTITRNTDATKAFTVSCWAQGAATVNGATYTFTGRTIGTWTYYEWKVSNVAQVVLAGTVLVDEVRVHPQKAQMTSYTYNLLTGITSQSDAAGNIQYYEYDAMNRLKLIRDMDRNVIKVMDYQYKTGIGN
jgi:hypothetical protein